MYFYQNILITDFYSKKDDLHFLIFITLYRVCQKPLTTKINLQFSYYIFFLISLRSGGQHLEERIFKT